MGLRINQNVAAMNSYRNLSVTDGQMSKSLEKLSSGFRINRAGDDAAGLAISEKLRGQVNGLNKASENAQNAISLIQTAEGGLSEQHSILQRMRELTVQSGSDTNTADDRQFIQDEVDALALELTRISTDTEFNGQKLLDASGGGGGDGTFNFQVGANNGQVISVSIAASAASDLAVDALDVTTGTTAGTDTALTAIDAAIATVSGERSNLGANQNRLEHTVNNLNVSSENLAASESRIRDTDMAKEMMSFTRAQILSQAGTAMLAQANQAPQGVLSLLR
jgi:flagellin